MASREIDLRIGSGKVEARRNLPVLQREDCLDQARHACGGIEMADVRFTEPIAQKPDRAVDERKAFVSARISMGSPTGVPEPCAST